MCSKEPEPPPPTEPPPPAATIVRDDGCVCPAPEEKKKCEPSFATCPYDPRFPDANQTKHCYTSFVDYQRCVRLLGLDYPGCKIFLKCYKALCPVAWTERWFEQMENGTFPRKIYPPKPIIRPGPDDSCADIEEEPPPPPPPCP